MHTYFCLVCQTHFGGVGVDAPTLCPTCRSSLVPLLDPEAQDALLKVCARMSTTPDANGQRQVDDLVPLVMRVVQGNAKARKVLFHLAGLTALAEEAARLAATPARPANIQPALRGLALKAGAHYPGPLPAELQPFYCYPLDAGHSLLVLPASLRGREPIANYLVPAPVKTVLRLGWHMERGVPVVDVEYDSELGLVAPAEDEEW